MYKLFIYFFSLLLFSCNIKKHENDEILVRVGKSALYLSDIAIATPDNFSEADSTNFAKNYIDKWVKNQLLLEKAELNLDQNRYEIRSQVEDYRTFLLINKYQQELILQKLDTIITMEDIETYYSERSGDFKLLFNIVKLNYIKLPIATYDADKVRRWYRSDNEDDLADLQDYCYQNAHEFEFSDEWMKFDDFLKIVPLRVKDQQDYLKKRQNIEITDSLYRYFIHIKEYKIVSDTSPLPFVQNDLKKVILNKRKIKFLTELENNIYLDALDKNKIEFFNK
jgi:hypothetical protein